MIRVILFDLGGVLVDWDGVGPLVELTGGRLSPEEARRFWFESPWVSRFERGKCTPGEFASGVVAELGLSVSPETFIEDFKSWDRGLYPGVPEMLDALRGDYILACITNNNRVYTESLIERYELDRKFHHFFVSYQTGLTKPSSEAFENVLRGIGVPPSEVVYFDDNAECVESAARSGIRAYKVSGMGQLRERMNFLREKGILGTVSRARERRVVMNAEVQIIEGGKLVRTEKMKLKPVKEFSDDTIIYENEDGRAVVFFRKKNEYILISIDMA